MYKKYKVALIGDFTARCVDILYFVRFDDPIMEVLGLDQVDRKELFNECTLETLGFPIEYSMCDKYVNTYGYRLVQLCRNMDIHITNGRVDKDRYIGSLTCRDNSTVDYLIVSS